LIELSTAELARLRDLRQQHTAADDLFGEWLAQDIGQTEQRLVWYREKLAVLGHGPIRAK
jgi:hypothetical protein